MTDPTTPALLACPFCGGCAMRDGPTVECIECGTENPPSDDPLTAWNTRALARTSTPSDGIVLALEHGRDALRAMDEIQADIPRWVMQELVDVIAAMQPAQASEPRQ